MTGTERFDSCLLCGGRRLRFMRGYEKDHIFLCLSCGFVFCQVKPSEEVLNKHYSQYPRARSIGEITLKRYDSLLDSFELYRKNNNMIDVGCGDGHFLAAAKKRGWNVFGTEFTQEAIEVCEGKGIRMTKGSMSEQLYSPGTFDIVTSFEVIEHINTPQSEAKIFNFILRQGGVAYVTTPNFNSISRNILGPKWNIIEYPEHLSYYTPKTLTRLFEQNNFKMVEISTTGISFDRFHNSGSNQGNASLGADEQLRQKAENKIVFKMLKSVINHALNLTSKGDSLKALFKKN
ncbi:MAG: class I SAM-dependent methyltransferase [Bacteroidetes bacterium]|nr:class I SAM-dependent methyltransferase [Bacteroidota bacterium]